jgi:hypothetical protein
MFIPDFFYDPVLFSFSNSFWNDKSSVVTVLSIKPLSSKGSKSQFYTMQKISHYLQQKGLTTPLGYSDILDRTENMSSCLRIQSSEILMNISSKSTKFSFSSCVSSSLPPSSSPFSSAPPSSSPSPPFSSHSSS